MLRVSILMSLISLLIIGCTEKDSEERRFGSIDAMCDSIPRQAISMLDSIDLRSLSESDRHRYDLLTIKSRDKAYERHTSDSLILDVIDYYESHQDEGHYPEALYYGGRVYSDIGDLPTALTYFQKAIDSTPDDEKHRKFKSTVLSQTGRLLEDIRLYKEAIPYIEKSIDILIKKNDSLGIFYDKMLLTNLYINNNSIEKAKKHINETIKYSHNIPIEDQNWMKVRYASIFMREGKNDSALSIIRPQLCNSSKTQLYNYTLAIAAKLYKEIGIADTAYFYAKKLAFSPFFNNRITGFNILFSPDIYPMIPKDSIAIFVQAYSNHMESYLNKYESQETLLQNSKFNYNLHKKEREKAEKEKIQAENTRNTAIYIGVILMLLLIILVIYIKYKNIKTEIKLRIAIQLVQSLEKANPKQILFEEPNNDIVKSVSIPTIEYNKSKILLLPFVSKQETLRKSLLERLKGISKNDNPDISFNKQLPHSSIISKLHKLLTENKGIKNNDFRIWKDIENAVHQFSPEFKSRLMILTLDKMSEKEYQVALLTRCGFKPKEISQLLIKGKSTATDRRRSLARKIFGLSADNTALDQIIYRL